MKVTFVLGILFASSLSIGCVAQAGTDPSVEQEEGLTVAAPVETQQQRVETTKVGLHNTVVKPKEVAGTLEKELGGQVQGLSKTDPGDPGAPAEDDGDGKEPDPHPWHTNVSMTAR